jgi:amidase
MGFDDYELHDAMGLAALVRAGKLDPEALLDAAEARHARHNPRLNAVILPAFAQAREQLAAARAAGREREGVFAGVPVLVKDLISNVRGLPTGSGNRLLRRLEPPAAADSEFIRRLRATGALIVGKTNTPEFGLTPFTEPESDGPTRNPWDLARSAGGSSGGSAAAVAAGIVPLATGGDGGGSIRIPASCCGLFGLKPSRGRVPTGPQFGELWSGYVSEHGLTRSVRDSAALLDAVAGADTGAPVAAPVQTRPFLDEVSTPPGRLRVGVCRNPWLGHGVDAENLRAMDHAEDLLRRLDHVLHEVALPIARERFAMDFLTVLGANLAAELAEIGEQLQRRVRRQDVEPATWALALLGRGFGAAELVAAQHRLQAASRAIAAVFEDIDVLMTPTLGSVPPLIGALQPTPAERLQLSVSGALNQAWLLRALGALQQMADKVFDFIPYTPVFNVTGQPAMSVPLHWSDQGLPVGLQFVGRFGDEAALFRLAGQLERAQPWSGRWPPVAG